MPLIFVLAVRLYRAFKATFDLLSDREVMRALPWPYLKRLPRQNALIGLTFCSLVGTFLAFLVTAAAPHDVSEFAAEIGIGIALIGLGASWARAIYHWQKLRR
jgi:hypothetical protein